MLVLSKNRISKLIKPFIELKFHYAI